MEFKNYSMFFPFTNKHAMVQDSDPTSVKFEGALVNALIFVVFVGIMTFVLFLLFKYGVSPMLPPPSSLPVPC